MINETLLDENDYIDCPLVGFIEKYQKILDSAPPEYRNAVRIEVVSDEDSWVTSKIYYCRPITAAEADAEARKAQRDEDATRDKELAELDRLKRKYP